MNVERVECPNFPSLMKRLTYFKASKPKYRKIMIQIFDFLILNPDNNSVNDCHKKTGLARTTLLSWRDHVQWDPRWRPWKKNTNKNKMILTVQEELSITDELFKDMLDPGYFCPQSILKARCLKAFNDRNQDPDKNFTASYGFLRNFRRRAALSLRRPTLARRPDPDDNEIAQFEDDLMNAFEKYDNYHILNADETSVRLCPIRGYTLCKRGAKKTPNYIPCETKKCFTATCTVTASGKKLPIWFLAKGTDPSCVNVFGEDVTKGDHQTSFSPSGWMNKEIMKEYIGWLSDEYNGDPLCLVLDRYGAHYEAEVTKFAKDNNIEIILVPSGLTSAFQPLDRSVYGVVKSHYSALCLRIYTNNQQHIFSQKEAATMFIRSYRQVQKETILDGWNFDWLE